MPLPSPNANPPLPSDLPEDFLARANHLLGNRLSAETPITAKTGEGLYEAIQSVALAMGVKLKSVPGEMGEHSDREILLDRILRASALRQRKVTLPQGWQKSDAGPLLAFRKEDQRAVALIPHSTKAYSLVDPVEGSSRLVTPAIAAELHDEARMVYRPFPDGPVNARQVLAHALRGEYGDLGMVVWVGILGALLGLLNPLMTEMIINEIIPRAEISELWQIGFILLVSAVAMTTFHATAAFAMLRVEGRGDHAVQTAVWSRVFELNTEFFKRYSAGDLANRVDGINAIRHTLSATTISYVLGAVFSFVNLALIFYYSWKLAIVALILVIIAGALDLIVAWIVLKYRRLSLNLAGRITGLVYQLLSGVVKWKVQAAEARALAQWSDLFLEKKRVDKITGYLKGTGGAVKAAFPVFAILVNYSVFFFFLKNELNVGEFMAFSAAFGQLFTSFLAATGATVSLVSIIPYYERVRPILIAPLERPTAGADPGPLTGKIETRRLSFRYSADGPKVLHDLTFSIEPGEFVAIVGSSGCGKSTLVRLLLGFENPSLGEVLYNGRDFRNLDLPSVRRQIGVVLQHDRVRTGDIFQNIVGNRTHTVDEAWEAAEKAGIADDIRRMPMGMHTHIPEGGTGFSGGQLQRLVIARALINRPPILIMDEATSALDNVSQKLVTDNICAMKMTRIVIAQRLSTIQRADRIIVFENGGIAETGPFEELIQKQGAFYALAARQLV